MLKVKAPQTIFAKGLILISVPLLVELAFGTGMFALQKYYDTKLNKERIALETNFHLNELFIVCTEVLLMKGYYCLYGGEKPPIEEKIHRLKDVYSILKKVVANNAEQTANLERINENTFKAMDRAEQLRPIVGSQESAMGKRALLLSDLEIFQDTYHLVDAIAPEIHKFEKPEFLRKATAVEEVEKSTRLVNTIIVGSFAGSLLVAVLLFVYFIRSINRGVNVMVENTGRFERGEDLIPSAGGEDELARVDAAFHGMADEIKEAQRTKQAVLAMISHDLRSPLTSVLGYFSMLNQGVFGDPPPAAVAASEVREKEIENLIRQISDLLDLEKIEAGKLSIRPRTLSAKKVIDQSIHAVFMAADEQGVTVNGTNTAVEIYADPDRIVQALTNLITTAVRMSPSGSEVDASVGQENGTVEIRVTSPSAVVPPDELHEMFDRYHQTEGRLRLSLPLSKEIIKLHGGTIGVNAEQQRGCTFWMRLPPEPAGTNS